MDHAHTHAFLAPAHASAERRTWAVIALCVAMMLLEIGGGLAFHSIALVADGLHMSTHAGALLLAALAYTFARRHADDPRFTFGTGKLGDLAGFTSAVVLAMIALLIGYEAVGRLFAPVPIQFGEAIPIAVLGLVVNVASAWLLGAGHDQHGHDHGHNHSHAHAHAHAHAHDDTHTVATALGPVTISIVEDGGPPVFQLRGAALPAGVAVETIRPDGARQRFPLLPAAGWLQSADPIPEPHAFTAVLHVEGQEHEVAFTEHAHDAEGGDGQGIHRDNNMRAAVVHVLADAAVSVLVIAGLLLARVFGWLWIDPLVGLVGAAVIAAWAWTLVRDTGAILLDMVPDRGIADRIRQAIQSDGDRLTDLHLWRLGPGHLGAIVAVSTPDPTRTPTHYRTLLAAIPALSHLTIEVQPG